MRHDLNADIAWERVDDAPVAERTRAYRWFPLSYPILARWAFEDDWVRSPYAVRAIGHGGGPLAAYWLHEAIRTNPSMSVDVFPLPSDATYETFRREFGLADPKARRALAREAVGHLHPPSGDDEESRFDEGLLSWLGLDALPALAEWTANGAPDRLKSITEVLPYDPAGATPQETAEIRRLRDRSEAAWKATTPTPEPGPTQAPGEAAVFDAIVALNAGDRRGVPLLRAIADGDLRRLNVGIYESDLLAVADTFPHSRFARGCRAYDALRGGTYFGRDEGPDDTFPPGSAAGWRAWLASYPDHPGADDAAYWLGRRLQRDGRGLDAAGTYADALERRIGDGDMRSELWLRLEFMLDVGATEAELAAFERDHPGSAFAPFARYARAVRRARAGDFRNAIALDAHSGIERAIRARSLADLMFDSRNAVDDHRAQLALWHTLAAIAPDFASAPSDARDRLASAWNDDDGWRIGYLVLFNGGRDGGATIYGDPSFVTPETMRNARGANQNAQTIALAKPLTAPSLPHDIRERNQRRIVTALYREQAAFPDIETELMGALPTLPSRAGYDTSLLQAEAPYGTRRDNPNYAYEARANEIEAWWARQTIVEAERYVRDYPHEEFAATALLAAYEVSGQTTFLERTIASYPDGPRTDEARALLWRATTPR